MKVCEKIKHLRQLQGWSQEEIANKLNMSPNGYGNIERGDTDITLSKLERIAELFNIGLAELFDLNERNIFNLITDTQNNSQHCSIDLSVSETSQLKNELEKQRAVNKQQIQEIIYLRGLVDSILKK
jgi:transcriptional regulator with XRE-family HTH domain